MIKSKIQSIIESILFFSGEAVPIKKLCEVVEIEETWLQTNLEQLNEIYLKNNSGIMIVKIDDTYQMCTAADNASYIEKFLQKPIKKLLTPPLLETLAIVAYSQPITKIQIEDIRGVRSDHTISKLLEYHLICEVGRLNVIGKPILFGTTNEFLRHFGFTNIDELPEVREELIEKFKNELQEEIDYYE